MDPQQRDALGRQVLEVLEDAPGGLSEYALINHLRDQGHPAFQRSLTGDNLSLFRTHFLLFHVLYRLRMQLWLERRAIVEISPLRIVLLAYRERAGVHQGLAGHDPLCEYYLDAEHLEATTAEQVHALLQGFWSGSSTAAQRVHALDVMGLSEPVDEVTIRRQYRRLVMRHHPDRGGDKERLQAVNAAMDVLMPARR